MDRGIIEAIRDWCKSKFQPIGNYAAPGDIPTQTSQLTNDSGYVTNEADNLVNYYKKSAIEEKGYLTSVPLPTAESIGGIRPDGTTITMDADGTIHAVSSQELAENILGGES